MVENEDLQTKGHELADANDDTWDIFFQMILKHFLADDFIWGPSFVFFLFRF